MSTKAVSKKRPAKTALALPAGLPDLPWYRDAANRKKRQSHIQNLCEQIAREFHPDKIILFGSQAYGKPTLDSDIDLLVVMSYEGSPLRQAGEILKRLQVWMPVDLIVRSASEIKQRLGMGDSFTREILERGKVLYDSADR